MTEGWAVLLSDGYCFLLGWPYCVEWFGTIEGRLDFISNIPTDSGYMAKVDLPNGLQTNYKKMVQYHEGLVAMGEIIAVDTKLSDRLFYQLRDLLQKR